MELAGSYTLSGNADDIWHSLHDPQILKDCIPGAQSVELTEDGSYSAVVAVKVGPVKARFKGLAEWVDIEPVDGASHAGQLKGEGKGGPAGFVKGRAVVFLNKVSDDGVALSYEANAAIGGKLAQVGQRLMDSVAQSLASQFFANFAARVENATDP